MRALVLGAVVGLLLAGCNATLEGESAPELAGAAWVRPDGTDAAPGLEGKWAVIAFFSPT